MDFNHALTYIFEDKQWVNKIVLLIILLFAAALPVLGLIPLALCLGFLTQLAGNVRNGLPRPLPKWDDYGEKLSVGGHVLLALIIYNLPTVLLLFCVSFVVNIIGGGFLGAAVNLMMLCCAFPLTLLYTLFAWTLLAAGMAEYIETGKRGVFYRPTHLYDVLRTHGQLTLRWMLAATIVNLVTLLALFIPCLGWLLVAALTFPVHGHLLGQYARQLAIKAKI